MYDLWPAEDIRYLPLSEFDERYRRYRLSVAEAEQAMVASLKRYGQIAPVVVCLSDETVVLIDGFKRMSAARSVKGFDTLAARKLDVDARAAKAALYALNRVGRGVHPIEESWIVHALVREDHLTQVEVAELLGHHKSWVCRRLALLEQLCEEGRDDLRLGLHLETIRHLLARYPKITARRIFEELQRDGYTGGYSILSERVAELRLRTGKPFTERFETGPGVQAQMGYAVYTIDFTSEGRRRVNLFSYLLGYSRRQYLRFVESQDLETTLREHIRAFEHLGGVAATCLYDNMKVVVDRWEDGQPIYNRRFLCFATHYGFRPTACRPRRPQTKDLAAASLPWETSSCNGLTTAATPRDFQPPYSSWKPASYASSTFTTSVPRWPQVVGLNIRRLR